MANQYNMTDEDYNEYVEEYDLWLSQVNFTGNTIRSVAHRRVREMAEEQRKQKEHALRIIKDLRNRRLSRSHA